MKAAIVVPTCRPEKINQFLNKWHSELKGHRIIIICDSEGVFEVNAFLGCEVYCRKNILGAFQDDAWIIPTHSSTIRSFGVWLTQGTEVDMIVTLDDDVIPDSSNFLEKHYKHLTEPQESNYAWWSPMTHYPTRGMPTSIHRETDCVLSHGGWTGDPDFWAMHQILVSQKYNMESKKPFDFDCFAVPKGMFFPMSSMNLAWKPEISPLMYFLLMDNKFRYSRLGDIWCGIILKKILDHFGKSAYTGGPFVHHKRASDVYKNLEKEARCMSTNEKFWKKIDQITLHHTSYEGCYLQILNQLADDPPGDPEYFRQLKEAGTKWINKW